MHRDSFLRLRRDGPPSDPESTDELMVFSSPEGRAGQVDHTDEHHLFAWLDEIPSGGGGIDWGTNNDTDHLGLQLFTDQAILIESTGGNITIESDNDQVNIQSDNWNVQLYAGHYLNIEGHTTVGINSSGSIGLVAPIIDIGGGAIVFDSTGTDKVDIATENINLQASDRVLVEGQTQATLRALAGSVEIEAGGASDSIINLAVDGFWRHTIFGHPDSFMGDKPGHLFLNNSGGDGSRIEFHDLGGGGGPLLRVDIAPDGSVSYHMKAGGTWVTDL